MNLTMVFSYCSSCTELPVKLVGFQVKGLLKRLNLDCMGEYVIFNERKL